MEVLVDATPETQGRLHSFLKNFVHVPIDQEIGALAVLIRQQHRIKLTDAIVWATAQVNNRILVNRNTKDFAVDDAGVRIPYRL